MIDLLSLDAARIRALDPHEVTRRLNAEEVFHIARMLGAYWFYGYPAANAGRVGLHAELKSGLHSEGYFNSQVLLEPENILRLMAAQLIERFRSTRPTIPPTHVAGVPRGATRLAQAAASLLELPLVPLKKNENSGIELVGELPAQARVIVTEDFCTRGTGFAQAVRAIRQSSGARVLPTYLAILNRGGMDHLALEGYGVYRVCSIAKHYIHDWRPESCPLCARGSKAIKPRGTPGNWEHLVHSQDSACEG